nr:MAG TPA: hypothetical protein [Caudoviricetes sp.]
MYFNSSFSLCLFWFYSLCIFFNKINHVANHYWMTNDFHFFFLKPSYRIFRI